MSLARTKFQPSDLQRKLLTVIQGHGYGCTVCDACTEAGIGRQTYYDWFRNEAFVAWWLAEQDRYFALRLGDVYVALTDAATAKTGAKDKKYNPAAIKLFLERFDADYAPQSRTDITTVGEKLGMDAVTDEELATALGPLAKGKDE
jgi:hypothetical protein